MGKKFDLTDIENAQLTSEGSSSDLAYLKANGPRALPTSPTANKWSADAILKQMYKQPEILFSWVQELASAVLGFAGAVDDYIDAYDTTLVHIAGTETITGSKSFGSSGSDNSKTLDIYFTTNLRGQVTSYTILPGNLGFSLGDSSHRWHTAYVQYIDLSESIKKGEYTYTLPTKSGTFAMVADVNAAISYTDSEITKIKDGTYTAYKSARDGNGNNIASTYETKSDATAKVARSNIVSILGEATSSLSGLLSATDKAHLDALYALLGASDDSDTVVNTINEILAIFNQYPEGVTLTSALATKVAIADVVNALDSNETTKPLSAKQGKVLNDRLAAVEEDYVTHDDVFAAGMLHVGEYNQETGEIEITYNSNVTSISYDDDTGILTIAY